MSRTVPQLARLRVLVESWPRPDSKGVALETVPDLEQLLTGSHDRDKFFLRAAQISCD
jgi:hypothetical protein